MIKTLKKILKRIMQFSIAGILLLGSMELTSEVLYSDSDIINNWRSLYAQEKNSIDYLIVGSSHAYASFDTEMIKRETGKKAYILASPSQTVTQAYFNVKEVLKYQKPERVILEAFSINDNSNWQSKDEEIYDRHWKKDSNIDGMRLGKVKLEAIMAQYEVQNWPYAFFEIARCHGNWKDTALILNNISFIKEKALHYQSFRPSTTQMSEENVKKYKNRKSSTKEYKVSRVNEKYFFELVKLCKEKNIELYMVMAPMYEEYVNKINYESRYKKISSLAETAGVQYLDCNMVYEEIGLDAQDFEDAYNTYHHMNAEGAEKVTKYLIEVLK